MLEIRELLEQLKSPAAKENYQIITAIHAQLDTMNEKDALAIQENIQSLLPYLDESMSPYWIVGRVGNIFIKMIERFPKLNMLTPELIDYLASSKYLAEHYRDCLIDKKYVDGYLNALHQSNDPKVQLFVLKQLNKTLDQMVGDISFLSSRRKEIINSLQTFSSKVFDKLRSQACNLYQPPNISSNSSFSSLVINSQLELFKALYSLESKLSKSTWNNIIERPKIVMPKEKYHFRSQFFGSADRKSENSLPQETTKIYGKSRE